MKQKSHFNEKILYELWLKQSFNKLITTSEGKTIHVLETGILNRDLAGPDFFNAKIKIGDTLFVGDIEIDKNYSDWKSHGHNIDKKYSSVILHIALLNSTNQNSVYTVEGRKINSICISDFIDNNTINLVHLLEEDKKNKQNILLRCCNTNKQIDKELITKVLFDHGIQKFESKRRKIYSRLKEIQFLDELSIREPVISYELTPQFDQREFKYSDFKSVKIWQQLFHELIFNALGYSNNKQQMLNLARNVDINFLSKIENDGAIIEKYEAALLKISGLFPNDFSGFNDDEKKYFDRLGFYWNSIQPFYDCKYFDESNWHFFRLRPQNFPTIRIAGGAKIIYEILHQNMIGTLIKKIDEIVNLNVLSRSLQASFLVKANGFWKSHYVAEQIASKELSYFIGHNRADGIVTNVALPFFSVYFEVFGNMELSQKTLRLYTVYSQHMESRIVEQMATSFNLIEESKQTILNHGLIELYRSHCIKNKCLECTIGKEIFN